MAKVYVTQRPPSSRSGPHIDLSPAERLGTLIYLSHRGEVERGTEQSMLWLFRDRLKDFDSRVDYILPMGHSITMALALLVAGERGNGTIRIMQWDKRLRKYEVFTLDLHAQPQQENGR